MIIYLTLFSPRMGSGLIYSLLGAGSLKLRYSFGRLIWTCEVWMYCIGDCIAFLVSVLNLEVFLARVDPAQLMDLCTLTHH